MVGFKQNVEGYRAKPCFQAIKDSPDGALCTPVQKIGKEQFLISEIKRQDTFFGVQGGLDRIHFNHMGRWKLTEITVQPSVEHFTVCNLCFMALAGFKFNLALQVDVAAGKKTEFNVLVNGAYGKTKFQMLHNVLIGGNGPARSEG